MIDNNRLGDGKCDYGDYNIREFGFDHGDCCKETCISHTYTCGENGFDCLDPMLYAGSCPATELYKKSLK